METLSRVFEPFFTTKPPGKGAGLGLSQVHGLAQQSDGDVRVTSRLGEGTRVTLLLPRCRSPALPAPPLPLPQAARAGEILLVDDNDEVRDVTTLLLTEAGHSVHPAASAEEALRLLARHGDAVRVLIADYAMPGMNGMELIALVRREWPGVATLLATGYADVSGMDEQAGGQPHAIVRKPYRGRELLAVIEQALRGRQVQDVETA